MLSSDRKGAKPSPPAALPQGEGGNERGLRVEKTLVSKHITFYIHAWHHVQNIAPIMQQLERRKVGYNIITFIPKDDNYPRVEQLFPNNTVKVFAESRAFKLGDKLGSTSRVDSSPPF